MSTGLQRLRMAIVKLNKLQRMPENMSQLLSNETHMPKNLYQSSSENSYRAGGRWISFQFPSVAAHRFDEFRTQVKGCVNVQLNLVHQFNK